MDELSELEGVCWLELGGLPQGLRAVVTTRLGGISRGDYAALNLGLHVGDDEAAVLENRRRIFTALGLDPQRASFMNQVHGNRVAHVGPSEQGRGVMTHDNAIIATDALITKEFESPLVVLSADCSPILVTAHDGSAIGVAHAGWRGAAAGMSSALVNAFGTLNYAASELIAVVGPTISQDAYEVGDEVVEGLRAVTPGPESAWLDRMVRAHVDVAEVNRAQLIGAGIKSSQVRITRDRSNDELFFSDRRARPCGRMALIAWRTEA